MEFKFKKKYGQNFLIDKNIINKIVNLITEKDDSLVVEIGCGDGRLTKQLCENYTNVLGYEIDLELKNMLLNNLKEYSNLEIIYNDFLKENLKEKAKKYNYKNLYVIANLPYYITTPIIEKLIKENLEYKKMIFMVQKEVGERFCAKKGNKKYNSLTVYLNYYFDIKQEFIVNRNNFIPKPNVDSLVISFKTKEQKEYLKNEELFFKLVRDSFKYKRKTLKNNLKDYNLSEIEQTLKKYDLDLNVRAENLDLKMFCDISNNLSI